MDLFVTSFASAIDSANARCLSAIPARFSMAMRNADIAVISRLNRSALWNRYVSTDMARCATPPYCSDGVAARPEMSYVCVMSISPSATKRSYAARSTALISVERSNDGSDISNSLSFVATSLAFCFTPRRPDGSGAPVSTSTPVAMIWPAVVFNCLSTCNVAFAYEALGFNRTYWPTRVGTPMMAPPRMLTAAEATDVR